MAEGIDQEVTALIAEIVEMEESELWESRDKNFVEDLGIDSMLALEILAALEKKFRIEIPEEEILELTSLDASIGFVHKKLEEAAKA